MRNAIFLLMSLCLWAQPKLTGTARFPFAADRFIGADPYGNVYTITNNTFSKSGNGNTLEFRKLSLGKITRADLTNPLLIVLFYEDFNSVVLIDNQLNEVKTIDFSKLENPLVVRAVGMAAQNKLWTYDSVSQQLGLFDYNTGAYKIIGTPLRSEPKLYGSSFNRFQWIDADEKHYMCDLFGKFSDLGTAPLFDAAAFDDNGNIIGSLDGKIIFADSAGQLSSISSVDDLHGLSWNGQQVVVASAKDLLFYKLVY